MFSEEEIAMLMKAESAYRIEQFLIAEHVDDADERNMFMYELQQGSPVPSDDEFGPGM